MKHIVWAVMAAALIFTGTESFARGFSVGVFGAYSIDGGNIEDSIDEKRYQELFYSNYYNTHITKSEYDTIMIPGSGAFAMYQFSNSMFVRTGVEFYQLVSGNDVSKSILIYDQNANNLVMHNYDYKTEYMALAAPLLLGITVSPDKGRTSIYAAAGLVVSRVEIDREIHYINTYFMYNNDYKSECDTIIAGFAGLIGVEKKFLGNLSIILEYAFYRCEENRMESGEAYSSQNPVYKDYEYTERYGLPRQQARIGVKYNF